MKTFKEHINADYGDEKVNIEFIDSGNNWHRITGGIQNRSQDISRALEQAKKRNPKARVRAVGAKSGRIYDILS